MLRELSVQNLALIEDVHVELQDGYCAWTGETGAGKSLLLTALGLVLGGKASAELVRAGKDEARAAAVFEIDRPRAPGRGRGRPRRPARRRPADPDPAGLGPGARLGPGQRPARDGRHPPGPGRAADRHPRPARGPRPARPRPPARPARRARRARGHCSTTYRQARAAHDALAPEAARTDPGRPRPPARAGLARVRARRAGRRRPAARRVRRADPRGPPARQRRAAPHGHQRGLRAALRGRPLGPGAARDASPGTLEPLARSVPELADAAADLERLADETREVAYSLRNLGQGLGRRPRAARGGRGPAGPLPPARHAVPLRADELAARRAEVEAQLAAIEQRRARPGRASTPRWPRPGPAAEGGRRRSSRRRGRRRARRSPRRSRGGSSRSAWRGASSTVEVAAATARRRPDRPAPARGRRPTASRSLFTANPGESPRPLRKVASGGELSRVTLAVKTVLAGADRVPDARLRRDRHGRRRPARGGPGQDARRAGPAPSGHLRDPPAPDGQLRRGASGSSASRSSAGGPAPRSRRSTTRTASTSWPRCSAATRPPRAPARRRLPCCSKRGCALNEVGGVSACRAARASLRNPPPNPPRAKGEGCIWLPPERHY